MLGNGLDSFARLIKKNKIAFLNFIIARQNIINPNNTEVKYHSEIFVYKCLVYVENC